MQAMCSTTSGQLVGWAAAHVNCDGSDTDILYYNTSGVLQGSVLPASWTICRPSYSSNYVNAIVEITQDDYDALVSKDPNTLYIIVG